MMDTLTVDGVLIIQDLGGGAYLDLDSSVIVNTGGKIVLAEAAGGNFGIGLRNASATVTVAGTLQVIGDNALRDFDSGSASLTIQPGGLLQIDDAGPFDVQALVINNGTMKQTQAVPAGATTHFLTCAMPIPTWINISAWLLPPIPRRWVPRRSPSAATAFATRAIN